MKNIFRSKFTFRLPKKKKFLIYDVNSEVVLSQILNKVIAGNSEVVHTRFEVISIPIFFLSILYNFEESLKFKNIYFNYIKTFIIVTKPVIVITFIDNDKRFYKLKKYFRNIKFIAIQNGYRFFKDDLFESIKTSKYIFECDEYYCLGKNIKNYLKDKIKAKIYVIGSLKNNYCTIKKNIIKKNICFISSFGISNHKNEKKLLNIIHQFCVKNNSNLEILPRRKSEEEEDFFKNILKHKNFIFHNKDDKICASYNIIDSSKMCVSLNATLGYESLCRGNKTLFFLNDRKINCYSFRKFGFPAIFDNEGLFWTDKIEEKSIIDKLSFIYHMSDDDWKIQSDEIIKKLMIFDNNNQFLIKNLK